MKEKQIGKLLDSIAAEPQPQASHWPALRSCKPVMVSEASQCAHALEAYELVHIQMSMAAMTALHHPKLLLAFMRSAVHPS